MRNLRTAFLAAGAVLAATGAALAAGQDRPTVEVPIPKRSIVGIADTGDFVPVVAIAPGFDPLGHAAGAIAVYLDELPAETLVYAVTDGSSDCAGDPFGTRPAVEHPDETAPLPSMTMA